MPGILVGVDGSDHSRQALSWAMREAARNHLPLTVMTVRPAAVRPATHIFWNMPVLEQDGHDLDRARAAVREFVDKTANEISETVPAVTVTAVTGDPAEELLRAARDADMLVVGARGDGSFAKLLLGSVSSKVMHHSACPTVVVPGGRHVRAPKLGRAMVESRHEFEHELEAIEAKVIELFAMVAEDLPGATQALLTGNNELVRKLAERDQVIDALYPEIEQLVNREILRQAPVASDLRFLLSVLRIVPELERSHDLVVDIASRADHILSDDLTPRCRKLVERMGDLASDMWRQAVDSWYHRDRSAVNVLSERDDEMDELYASLIAELASGGMTLPVTMGMTLVARFYERLADHALNIARRVVYLAGSAGN